MWANGGLVAAGDVVECAIGWLFGFCYGAHFWKGGVFGMCGNVRDVRIEFILSVRMSRF